MEIARYGKKSKAGIKDKDTRRKREKGRSRNGIHTWTSEYIHGRSNTYMGERIHIWMSKYIHGQENTYMGKRIHTWVSKYIQG